MTRYAFYAGLAAAALGAAAPGFAAEPATEAQQLRRQSIERAQRAAAPAVDGRRLIAELRACAELSPQSVRERCEMQARKTGGQGVVLKLDPNANYFVQDQFERFAN
ncbi:MAG: hypothetical protein ACT4N4_18125 [Rhodospirillales bacterium]